MERTVFLFDVDGTLLSGGGAGRRAMERAFESATGRGDVCSFPFDGMTDRAIVRQGLAAATGETIEQQRIDAVLTQYLQYLAEEVGQSAPAKPLPGAEEWLSTLRDIPVVALGLGTGNVEAGARIKLSRAGLSEFFSFGGFGCDHESRPTLLQVGADRGAARLGGSHGDFPVVVVGDTPKDVAAAHAIGAICIGVSTGRFTRDTLRQAGADLVADSLTEAAARWSAYSPSIQ